MLTTEPPASELEHASNRMEPIYIRDIDYTFWTSNRCAYISHGYWKQQQIRKLLKLFYGIGICRQIEDSFAKTTNSNLSFKFMGLQFGSVRFNLFTEFHFNQIEPNKFLLLIPSVWKCVTPIKLKAIEWMPHSPEWIAETWDIFQKANLLHIHTFLFANEGGKLGFTIMPINFSLGKLSKHINYASPSHQYDVRHNIQLPVTLTKHFDFN